MPDRRTHRGAHPEDDRLFAPSAVPALRSAVADLSLLLTRGYAEKSSLKLVGDRHDLTQRQREAVLRCSCADGPLRSRAQRRVEAGGLGGRPLALDGYNILITLEAAMGAGLVFLGRDGCCRDLASIHGTYRTVAETRPAIELLGTFLDEAGASDVTWLLDSPVSNSGKLKSLIEDTAGRARWPWSARLCANPDAELLVSPAVVASSDGIVLNGCGPWVNLVRAVIERDIPGARIIDLSPAGGSQGVT